MEVERNVGAADRVCEGRDVTYVVVVLQISKILVLVLAQSLRDVWVLDHV